MAGDWIKMRGNLWDDPRVSRLCDLTGSTEGPVIGALYWLWATADQHTVDGCLPGLTLRQIDRKTGLQGFGDAMCEIEWLRDDPQGVVIVDFEDHNGASAKKRCQTAKRVANFKAGNAPQTLDDESGNASSVSTTLPREEKRREEGNPSPDGDGADGAVAPPPPAPDDCPHQAIIDVFHAALPAARQIREWTPTRAALLRTRWREKRNRQSVEWWAKLFAFCARSAFLTGRATQGDRRPFELGLDWLLKSENFVKVIEGKYHEPEELDAPETAT